MLHEANQSNRSNRGVSRRELFQQSASAIAGVVGCSLAARQASSNDAPARPVVQTVLGPVSPDKLGVARMHEHAPIVDWSEMYETTPAPISPVREKLIAETARLLDAFHQTLAPDERPGTIVEATPIRVGRHPQLLVEAGYVQQVLVSHDHAPFYFPEFAAQTKRPEDWKALAADYTTVTTKLVESLMKMSVSKADLRTILVENPRRALSF